MGNNIPSRRSGSYGGPPLTSGRRTRQERDEFDFFFNPAEEPKRLQILGRPLLRVGNEVLSGKDLLKTFALLPAGGNGERYLSQLTDLLLPHAVRDWQFTSDLELIGSCLKTLEVLGCLERLEVRDFWNQQQDITDCYRLTRVGEQILGLERQARPRERDSFTETERAAAKKAAQKLFSRSNAHKIAEAPSKKPIEPKEVEWIETEPTPSAKRNTPVNRDRAPASYEGLTTEQLKVLVSGKETGNTGWEILKTVAELDRNRFFLSRAFRSGLTQDKLNSHYFSKDTPAQGFLLQLQTLEKQSFLENIGTAQSPRWQLTVVGKAVLDFKDPLTPGGLKSAEMQRVLQYDIDRIGEGRKEKEARFTQLETELQKAEKLLETAKKDYGKAMDELKPLQEKMNQPNPNRSQTDTFKLSEQVRRKTLNADLLQSQVTVGEEMIARLNQQITVQHNAIQEWDMETHAKLKALTTAKFRAQSLPDDHGLGELIQAVESESTDVSSRDVLDSVENRHFRTEAELEQLATEAKANSIVADQLVKDTLANLSNETPSARKEKGKK